ncbi:helix-turn-helix domain-containing protein [Bengtsoniella intestinalis]|uniref:helix-turn-helix domain-containing protein n=1 Tax=Bengtsoniella intestinalis TaxID=3073143 RepID=UPI00391F8A12
MFHYKNPVDNPMIFDCAKAFHHSTGLPCTVSSQTGEILLELGYGCNSCNICEILGRNKSDCSDFHRLATQDAHNRFGGKYVYTGYSGLTYFVSPIIDDTVSRAKITVGPFLMVEPSDYEELDLRGRLGLGDEDTHKILQKLTKIQEIDPKKVQHLSTLLFMAVSFLNSATDFHKQIEDQEMADLSSQVFTYITDYKHSNGETGYPFDVENKLLESVSIADKKAVQGYLNELLGYILFSSGGDLLVAKSRVYELLILISRAAIKSGADQNKCLLLTHNYIQVIPQLDTMDALCLWLSKITNKFIDNVFTYLDVNNLNVIPQAVRYIHTNYSEKITLESVAATVYLSPTYFSKMFKEELHTPFTTYINQVRVEQSKSLLRKGDAKLSEVALAVGFEDQSYFTKVFKKITGQSPLQYRKRHMTSQ